MVELLTEGVAVMGTRSLTIFLDKSWINHEGKNPNGDEIVVMYRQFDGYIDGHGHDIGELLSGFKIVNGFTPEDEKRGKIANGAGCLAAQVVAHFKNRFGVGAIYLYPAGTREKSEDYVYTIEVSYDKPLKIIVDSYGDRVFEGTPEELAVFEDKRFDDEDAE